MPTEARPTSKQREAELEPALPPASVRQGSLSLVERTLPPMLTPSRCEAGRWQPLRLVGEGVELTLLARDTGAPLED